MILRLLFLLSFGLALLSLEALAAPENHKLQINEPIKLEILLKQISTLDRDISAPIVHEWAHRYDALKLDQGHKISENPKLQNLLNWRKQGLIFRGLTQGNLLAERSPNPLEFKSPQEAFAVNFTHFVLDSEFQCRRPAVYRFLKEHFQFTPSFSEEPCRHNYNIAMNTADFGSKDEKIMMITLDPRRIYQIHYLFASKGPAIMSKWGHAMYRIILCSPERAQPGPECLDDDAYHVVVSYRANINDVKLNYWAGLWGKYPSQLFMMPLLKVKDEYNKEELRDLLSVPMNLSSDEKEAFIERVLEHFWSYQGKYKFITNNCATEALNLMKGITPNEDYQKVHPMTPKGLYHDLERFELMDTSVQSDPDLAERNGYLLPSRRPQLMAAYKKLVELGMVSSTLKFDDYTRNTNAPWRKKVFETLYPQLSPLDQRVLAANSLVLESYILVYTQKKFFKKIGGKIFSNDNKSDPQYVALQTDIKAVQKNYGELMPWKIGVQSYGIPLASEIEKLDLTKANELLSVTKTLVTSLQDRIAPLFKEEDDEIKAIVANNNAFDELTRKRIPGKSIIEE